MAVHHAFYSIQRPGTADRGLRPHPPGEDPRAVRKAARLVLPEDTYQDLAGHLG
jgi:hypothetical protein